MSDGRRAAGPRVPIDVLVVCSASTPGNRRSETELVAALGELGLEVGVAATGYGWLGRRRLSLNLIDLTQAVSLRRAVSRTCRRIAPRAIVYGTGGAGLLEPAARLRRAAVRFDALAVDNRPGRRHLLQRLLQRRMIRLTALLLPFSGPAQWPPPARGHRRRPIALPTPVRRHARPDGDREPVAVCYAGAPEKKRLDLVINAWGLAELPYELIVTGISAVDGRAWLQRRGIREPPRVRWCGHLDAADYRGLTSRAQIYVAASRYEDYGISQLEALADGALLVTTASEGPYEALALARSLAPGLVAETASPAGLARSLRTAAAMDAAACTAYRERAVELLEPYSPESFRRRLSDEVLPALLSQA